MKNHISSHTAVMRNDGLLEHETQQFCLSCIEISWLGIQRNDSAAMSLTGEAYISLKSILTHLFHRDEIEINWNEIWGETLQWAWLKILNTHWGLNRMAAIMQMRFSKAFSWGRMSKILFNSYWSCVPEDETDNMSALVQLIMACKQWGTSLYLNQCWPQSLMPNRPW